MTKFQGFGDKGLPFLKGLAFHQDRDWFQKNKHYYDTDLREPMEELIADLNERFAKAGLPLRADEKKSIFRISRDIRFSKDKRPYNTHISAVFTPTGTKDGNGLVYVHITPPDLPASWERMPPGSFMAAGFHQPDPAVLEKIRRAIAKDPKAFQAMEKKLAGKGLAIDRGGSLTRLPRGFEKEKDNPAESAIRLKSFSVEEKIPNELITRPELAAHVLQFAKKAEPLLRFGWAVLPQR